MTVLSTPPGVSTQLITSVLVAHENSAFKKGQCMFDMIYFANDCVLWLVKRF